MVKNGNGVGSMKSLDKLEIAANHESSSMNEDQRAAIRFALEELRKDTDLMKAIGVYKAIATIEKFEQHEGGNSILKFMNQCYGLNDFENDNRPGRLSAIIFKAGEMVKAELETI